MKLQVCVMLGLLLVLGTQVLGSGVASGQDDSSQSQDKSLQDDSIQANLTAEKPDTSDKHNSSSHTGLAGFKDMVNNNRGMLLRTLYVLVAVTAVIVLYFVVRTVRIRRRKSKTKKYGVITPASDMEMTPLDQDDDDEDMTVFEVNGIPK